MSDRNERPFLEYTDPSLPDVSLNPFEEPVTAWQQESENLRRSVVDPRDITGTNNFVEVGQTVGGVAISSARDIAIREAELLRARLFSPRRVTLGALLDYNPSIRNLELGEFFTRKLTSLQQSVFGALEEIGQEVANDPAVIDAVSQLQIVRQTANVINGTVAAINAGRNLYQSIEPIIPFVQIALAIAQIWFNPASPGAATNESVKLATQELLKASKLLINNIKNYIVRIEFNVPAILLGTLSELSGPVSNSRVGGWLAEIEAEAATVSNEIEWPDRVDRALRFTGTTGERVREASERALATPILENSLLYLGTQAYVNQNLSVSPAAQSILSSAFYDEFITLAQPTQANTLSTPFGDANSSLLATALSEYDIYRISGEILEANDTTGRFFTDRQLSAGIIEQLAKDGVFVNLGTSVYEEDSTLEGPSGYRGLFTQINDRITIAHNALGAISGEVRVNITEEIPVIDFFDVNNTSLRNYYPSKEFFDTIARASDLRPDGNSLESIPIWDVDTEQPATGMVNQALFDSPYAEYFYANRGFDGYPNLVVTSDTTQNPASAPGILAGLMSTPIYETTSQSNPSGLSTGPTQWQWINFVQQAADAGVTISRGAKYQPNHILFKGNIVPKPLQTSTPGFGGLAEETYDGALSLVSTVRAQYTQASFAAWNSKPFKQIHYVVATEDDRDALAFKQHLSPEFFSAFDSQPLWEDEIGVGDTTFNLDIVANPERAVVYVHSVTFDSTTRGLAFNLKQGRAQAIAAARSDVNFVNGFWQGRRLSNPSAPLNQQYADDPILYGVILLRATDTESGSPVVLYRIAAIDVLTPTVLFAAEGEPTQATVQIDTTINVFNRFRRRERRQQRRERRREIRNIQPGSARRETRRDDREERRSNRRDNRQTRRKDRRARRQNR